MDLNLSQNLNKNKGVKDIEKSNVSILLKDLYFISEKSSMIKQNIWKVLNTIKNQ